MNFWSMKNSCRHVRLTWILMMMAPPMLRSTFQRGSVAYENLFHGSWYLHLLGKDCQSGVLEGSCLLLSNAFCMFVSLLLFLSCRFCGALSFLLTPTMVSLFCVIFLTKVPCLWRLSFFTDYRWFYIWVAISTFLRKLYDFGVRGCRYL